jgi:DMSO reductase anchor subunit
VLTGLLAPAGTFLGWGLAAAIVLLGAGLLASFLHLGRPERAWRAATMWRTSWLSREVIVLPAFIGLLVLWWLAQRTGNGPATLSSWLAAATIATALLLWLCTAMIYVCIRFIQEWAHPLTVFNYVLIGMSSGLVLACGLAAAMGESGLLAALGPFALAATLVAGAVRFASFQRNAHLRPASTLQSATGIRARTLTQLSMGMSAGSFNTREFFHGVAAASLRHIRLAALFLGFALPALLMLWGLLDASPLPWLAALGVQLPGLLAERWVFFAQARHPQNLYYQRVS